MEIVSTLCISILINCIPIYCLFSYQKVKSFCSLFILLSIFILTIIIFIKSLKQIYQLQSGSLKNEWKQYFKKDLLEILLESLIISTILSAMLVNTYLLYLSYSFYISIIYLAINFLPSKTIIDFFMD